MASATLPRISVVVVSDYGGAGRKDWADERRALQGLGRQDIAEPFDILLVENEACRDSVPPELSDLAPGIRLCFSRATRSSALKNDGTAATTTPLVAVMEADCTPAPDWLRRLSETIDRIPEADVVSGRTIYGQETPLRRVLALLDRAYLDIGAVGPIQHVGNNGALYRRAVLDAHPYSDEPSPFVSADIRLRQMLASGARPYFQPGAVMVHRLEGFRFVLDLRANTGFQVARMRMLRERPPGSLAYSIASIVVSQTRADLRSAGRVGRDFLRPWDWPLYAVMLLLVRLLEIPGMVRGLGGHDRLPRTGYR